METIKQLIIDFMAYISNTNGTEDDIKKLGQQYTDKYKMMGIENADIIFNIGVEFIMAYKSFPDYAALMDNRLLGHQTKRILMERYKSLLPEMLENLSYILDNINVLTQNIDILRDKVIRRGIFYKPTATFAEEFLNELYKNCA